MGSEKDEGNGERNGGRPRGMKKGREGGRGEWRKKEREGGRGEWRKGGREAEGREGGCG